MPEAKASIVDGREEARWERRVDISAGWWDVDVDEDG